MSDRIEVDYQQLEKLGTMLSQRADTVEEQMNRLRQLMQQLEPSWRGDAADEFYREMHDLTMPAMQRLYSVLGRTGQILKQVSQTYRAAEEQASNLFKGGGGFAGIGGSAGGGFVGGGISGGAGGTGGTGGNIGGGFTGGAGGAGGIGGTGGVGGEIGGISGGAGGTGGVGGEIGGTGGAGGTGGNIGGSFAGGAGGAGGSFGDGSVTPNDTNTTGGGGGGFRGGGVGGGFSGGGGSAAEILARGGATINGFNTVRDAVNALNLPTNTTLDPLSAKVIGKEGAMMGGLGNIGGMSSFFNDLFGNNANMQDLVKSVQSSIQSAMQSINAFVGLVNALF